MEIPSQENPFEAPQIAKLSVASEIELQKPGAKQSAYPKSFLACFLLVLLAINGFIVTQCWDAWRFGVIGMVFVIGPIMNGVAGLFSIFATPVLKSHYSNFPVGRHIVISIGLPIAAIIGTWSFVTAFVPMQAGS